jgi:hypothetical protein
LQCLHPTLGRRAVAVGAVVACMAEAASAAVSSTEVAA